MIYISSNNDRHPVTKTFTPLHYTCRHFTSFHLKLHPNKLHFLPFKLHPTALHYPLIWLKGKGVPLQAWSGPEVSRKLRFPDFMTTAQDGGKVVSLTHRPSLPPGNTPGTHFCQRLSRPQGHSATGRIVT
jgi:hypothetical protein